MKLKIKQRDIYIIAYSCFLIAFIISVSQAVIYYPALNYIRTALRFVGYLLCIEKLISIKLTNRNYIAFGFFLLAVLLSRYITGIDTLVVDFLMLSAIQNVNIEKLFKTDLIIRLTSFVFLYLTVAIGLVPDSVGYRNGILNRFGLGFNHANRLGVHLLIACLDVLYLFHLKFKIKDWFIILGSSFIVGYIANSRASLFGILMIIIYEVASNIVVKIKKSKVNPNTRLIKFLSCSGLSLCIMISFLLPILYSMGRLTVQGGNDTIGSRIIKAAYSLAKYGITIFGQKIDVISISEAAKRGIQANGIDNMYVYILVNFGLVFFIAVMFLCYYTLNFLINCGNYTALICFLILMVFALVENPIIKIECNGFLIFLGYALLALRSRNTKGRFWKSIRYKYE